MLQRLFSGGGGGGTNGGAPPRPAAAAQTPAAALAELQKAVEKLRGYYELAKVWEE